MTFNDTLGWLEWLAIATLIAAAFFIAFPDLDLDVSLIFGDVSGFHLSESRVLTKRISSTEFGAIRYALAL